MTSKARNLARVLGAGAGDRLSLPSSTSDIQNPTTSDTYFNTQTKALKIFAGNEWGTVVFASLGSEQNPAESAQQILLDRPNAPDGTYFIKTTSGVVPTYCMMSWGGYMLVAKVDNNYDVNWAYSGGNWSTGSPINEASCANISAADAVSRLYYEYVMKTGMRFSMNTVGNFIEDTAGGALVNRTARSAFTGSPLNSDRSRADFLNWIANAGSAASNWDNQLYCNTRGFNISASAAQSRYGITMNNENDCSSNDSSVGFGTYTNSEITGARSANCGGHRWSPDQRFSYNGWIWVR